MLRLVVLTLVSAVACALFIPEDTESSDIFENNRVDDNVAQLGGECPNCLNFTYTFGTRVNGDRLVKTSGMAYGGGADIKALLEYPPPDTKGSIVSFVESFIRQTNNLSTAAILEGGIGQRHILVQLTATHITYFEHRTLFYGYD